MKKAPRIFVLTLSFGSGHVRAAQAVAAELKRQAPQAEVRVVDALAQCRWLFRAFYVWPYWAMVRYAPALWKRFFEARVTHRHEQTAPAWAFRYGCPEVFEEIESFKPDTIVAVEVAACEMAVIAKREGKTSARIINVITDHEAEPVWVKPEVDWYVVADERVRGQLCGWGAEPEKIAIFGIPTDAGFSVARDAVAARDRLRIKDNLPIVLLMGGGQGPTRMDEIAARLCQGELEMHLVAIAGRDARAHQRLTRISSTGKVKLHILGWTEDVASLMHTASVLVTKPGGLTLAEAAQCSLPVVMFDRIPGPETLNAERFASKGAGVLTHNVKETVVAVENLLLDESLRASMSFSSRKLARPRAAGDVARLALDGLGRSCSGEAAEDDCLRGKSEQREGSETHGPVLILSISNGAGHTRAAEAIASAILAARPEAEVLVVDVADYMTRTARFTHVTAYLWLVKYAPKIWDRLDKYQKRQTHTSPEWYYRRGCRRLFELAGSLRPSALIATEVGCCEIAALIKRDLLTEETPLVAVNVNYDADRAWVQSEVNLYCAATAEVREELVTHGAAGERIRVWGVPLEPGFRAHFRREEERAEVCRRLGLAPLLPLILVAGGSCGLGRIEEIVDWLLSLQRPRLQMIVLTGRNERLRRKLERRTRREVGQRLRVMGWTEDVARLMRAADLLVSKFGNTFDEAMAAEVPLVGLEPPPGSERVQYRLLDEWGTGRAVREVEQLVEAVSELLTHREKLDAMRRRAREHKKMDAAAHIAAWVLGQSGHGNFSHDALPSMIGSQNARVEELVGGVR